MEVTLFVLKLCEKNSLVNLRFKIFIMAFRARKLFGTFEKRDPGAERKGNTTMAKEKGRKC